MISSPAQTVLDLTPTAISAVDGISGGTTKRMIGDIRIETSAIFADHVDLDVGILVVTADALAVGVVPDPATDATQDWYFWSHLDTHLPANDSNTMNQGIIPIDIKTSRRLRQGYRLVLVLDKGTTASAVNLSVGLRILWNLQP